MKRLSVFTILSITLFLLLTDLYAGGFFVSDIATELYQPDQRAVISWDGKKQTMFLSAGLKSNEIANFAWVIPVLSSAEPVVSPTDMRIHDYLAGFFRGKRKPPTREPGLFGKKIIKSVKIDKYDVSVVGADKSEDLINRLALDGYRLPEKTSRIIDRYMSNPAPEGYRLSFVINRIGLGDMYKDEIEEVKGIYDNVKNEYNALMKEIREIFSNESFMDERYRGRKLEDIIIDYLKTWSPRKEREKPGFYWLENYYNKIIKKEFKRHKLPSRVIFILNDETLRVEGNPKFSMSVSEKGLKLDISYDFNIMKYAWRKGSFSIDGYSLRENKIHIRKSNLEKYIKSVNDYGRVRSLKEKDVRDLMLFFSLEGFDYSGLIRQLDERVSIVEENVMPDAEKMAEHYLPLLVKLFNRIEKYNAKPQIYVKKFYDEEYAAPFREKIDSIINASSISLEARERFSELAEMVLLLRKGINTPLKIKFEPAGPVFPAGLSSANSGKCRVEVFLLSTGHAHDRKFVLQKDKKIHEINEDINAVFAGDADTSGMKWISWFGKVGYLRDLKKDVIFSVEGM